MIDQYTDFFQIEDNFAKIKEIPYIPIIESNIDFTPKITIAIPTFKRPSLLKEALNSAINQIDFNEYEIIVVDNDPNRGTETEKLINSYKCNYLSYYKNIQNIGMFNNWNRCIELAKGEYLTILNDDDFLNSNYLKNITNFLNYKNNLNFLFVGFNIIPNKKKYRANINTTCIPTFFEMLFGNINPGSLGVLMKKETAKSLGGFNDEFYPTSDYIYWSKCLFYYKNIFRVTDKLANYRLSINESLNINIQNVNLKNDKLLRKYIAQKEYLLRPLIKLSLPVFEKKQLNHIHTFINNFNILNKNKLDINFINTGLINRISYLLLVVIKKISHYFTVISMLDYQLHILKKVNK